MSLNRKALLLRMGPYDMTQAVPRAASTLQEMGYEITILSLDVTRQKPLEESVNGWRVLWFHHAYKSGNKRSFLWAWICWWLWVIQHLRKYRYDLVQASNLESIVPCVIAKKMRKFALVLDVRDPWGMNSANSKSLLMRTFRAMERWAAARVDGIVLSQGILDRTGLYFGSKVRRRIPAVQVLNVPGRDVAGQYCPPDTDMIRINFSGHISYVRNAQAMIDLAREMPQVQIDIIGDVRNPRLLAELQSLPNIKLYGRVPFEKAMDLLQQANLISVMYDTSTEVAVVSSANKMFEAMMMSRPYIASEKGFPGIIAERYNIGWTVPYGCSKALVKLVSDLLARPYNIKLAAERGRMAYEENFTWDQQKANLTLLYEYVTDNQEVKPFSYAGWNRMLGSVL